MADVNANIGIHIDTSQSLAEIKNLQRQLAQLYTSINKGSAAAAAAQKGLATNLMNTINAGGKFYAQMGTIRTSTESFTHALEKNKLTMREYFRFAGGSTRTFGRLFKSEFDTIGKVAEERVKRMQTQYIKLGRDASGAMKAISVTPTTLNMKEYGNQVAVAAQKQAILNQLLKQGSTNLLNFGKNTQWAGRQLMVGFTIPLAYFGTAAAKTFMDLEAQAIKFRRVYGDMFTTTADTNKALADIEALARQFTKYGVAVSKTMEMAASAAAMGKTGAELTAQVAQATRLAVLGNVEQEQALTTTISLTNAFGLGAEELAGKINFLNAVENQTVTAIEDLTIAIPKAGPVIESLGGSVEDLAFFLTAMREGGINASEGANALKSGLASLINPTDKAAGMLADMGININAIVEGNFGNLKETVIDFAQALDQLAPLERSRAIEQLFGKFQFARLDALFTNVTKEGGQAARVLDLAGKSVEELAILSERELKTVEDAIGTNFREAVEQLKISIAPIGKEFLKAITPVVEFLGKLFDKFNNLGDGTKKFIVILTSLVGLIGPTLLMTFGLVANGAANIIKLFILMRQGFLKLTGNSTILAQQTQYLNTEQMEAAVVAASLNQAHTKLTQQFTLEASAVMALRNAYVQATTAAARFAATNPGMMIPGAKGLGPIKGGGAKGFNKGTMKVPGYQKGTDSVPAMLTPGEAVIPEPIAQDDRFKPLVAALVSGEIKKYKKGTVSAGDDYAHVGGGKLTNIDEIIAKSGGGLSQTELRQAQMYKDILVATGQSGAAQAYGSLAYSFDSALNKAMAKQGVPLASFERAWLDRPDKWATSGFTASQASLVDRAILEQIKSTGITTVTDKHVDAAFRNLPESIKATPTYRSMAQLHDKIGSYSLGKGLGSTPATSKQVLEQAKRAGIIKDYRVEERVSSKGKQAIKSLYVVTNDGKEIYLGRGSKANRIYLADKSLSAAQKTAAKPKFVVGVGETIKTKDGKVSTVTGQTGKPKPAGMKVIGGGASDRRVIGGSNIASIFPRGFKGPRLTGIGAQGGIGEGATQAERAAGIKGGSISKEYRQKQTQVQQSLGKFDTEVKETTKQTKTLGQKFTSGANVFSGLTIAGSFMGGTIGDISKKLAPFGILLSTLTMMGPGLLRGFSKLKTFFIANPVALLITALLAAVATWKYANSKAKKMGESSAELAQQQLATADRMKQISLITGKVGATELAARKAESPASNRFTTGYERGKTQFGTTFLESEFGKQIYDTFVKNLEGGGREAAKTIALELGTYISDGVLSAEQAFSIARSIGLNLKDMTVSSQIKGELIQLIGPEGTDIIKDGIKIRVKLLESSKENVQAAIENVKLSTGDVGGLFYTPEDIQAVGKLAAYQSQYLQDVNSAVAASRKNMDDRVRELEIEKQKAKNAEEIAKINDKINTLKKEQNIEEESLRTKYKDAVDLQVKAYQEATAGLRKYGNVGTAYFAGLDKTVRKRFKGTGEEAVAEQFLKTAKGTTSQVFEVKLKALVAGGVFNPKTLTDLVKLFGPENEGVAEKTLELALSKKDPAKIAELVATLTGFENKQLATNIMLEATSEDGLKGKALENRLEAIARLRDLNNKEVNIEMFIQTNGIEALDSLYSSLDYVENIKGPITTKVISELQQVSNDPNMPNMDALLSIWSKYEALPDEVKKTVIQEYISLFKTVTDTEARSSLAGKGIAGRAISPAMIEAEKSKISADLVTQAAKYAEGGVKTGDKINDGINKNRDTTLDELLKRLKFIRKASIDAEKGVGELMRITSGKGLTNFGGVMQQLMDGPKGGFNREFISFLEGMDNATRKTYMTIKNGEVVLTKQGRALKEAFNEKVIGEYQVANRQALQDTKAQGAALLKLQASGVDSATALEMVADANLAVAINSKNITGKELRQMAKDAQTAKDEVKKLNLEVLNLAEDLKKKVGEAGNAFLAITKAREAGIVDPEILRMISEDQSIVNEILKNGFGSKTTQDILKSKAALKEIGEATEGIIDPAKAAIDAFDKLRDAAFKVFDRQSRQAQVDFENSMKRLASTVAKLPAAFANLTIEGAIDKANEDIDTLNRQIDEIQYRDIRPLDIEIEAKESAIDDIMKGLETQAAGMQRGFNLPAEAYKNVAEGLRDQINEMELDLEFNPQYGARFIEQLQDQISDIELEIELNFSRPIADLQEESSDLANDLTLMDRVADQINSKYDAQAEALQKVSDINQEILNQQKSQLDIAGAITQGDIAAAARAAQEARAQAAAGAAQRAGGVLDAARKAEIAAIRSPGGLTRTQIEERQFQISQQIYQLEEQSEIRQRSILAIQDQIRGIEEIRTQKQREIRNYQDQIAAGERAREAFIKTNILPLETAIKDLQEKRQGFINDIKIKEGEILKIQNEILAPLNLEVKAREKILKDQLDAIDAQKDAYDQARIKLEEALVPATEFANQSVKAETAFTNAKNKYEEMTKLGPITIRINEIVTRTVIVNTISSPFNTAAVAGKMYGGKIKGYMGGGKVKPMYLANGGAVGSDTVPAMLTPGEFVVNKASSKAFAPLLSAINDTKYPSILARRFKEIGADISGSFNTPTYSFSAPSNSTFVQPSYNISNVSSMSTPIINNNASVSDNSSSVYNYNVGITVGGTSASPDSIAKAVMNEIKYIDSQRIRAQRAI